MNDNGLLVLKHLSDDFVADEGLEQISINPDVIKRIVNPTQIEIFDFEVMGKSGLWRLDYSHIPFVEPPSVMAVASAQSGTLAGRNIAGLSETPPSVTGCTGYIMSASAFALIGSSLAESDGKVTIWVKGKVSASWNKED